jgi:hypothetical protein
MAIAARNLEQLSAQLVTNWGPRAQQLIDGAPTLAEWVRAPGDAVAFVPSNAAAQRLLDSGDASTRHLLDGVSALVADSGSDAITGVQHLWTPQTIEDHRLAVTINSMQLPKGQMLRPYGGFNAPDAGMSLDIRAYNPLRTRGQYTPEGGRLLLSSEIVAKAGGTTKDRAALAYVANHEIGHARQVVAMRREGTRETPQRLMPLIEGADDTFARQPSELRRAAHAFGVTRTSASTFADLPPAYDYQRSGLAALLQKVGIDPASQEGRALLVGNPRALERRLLDGLAAADPHVAAAAKPDTAARRVINAALSRGSLD